MIPGMVGKNTEKWLKEQDGGLPPTVSKFGFSKEEIFMNYEVLKEQFGSDAEAFPLGAVGLYVEKYSEAEYVEADAASDSNPLWAREAAGEFGEPGNYVLGANIAAFQRVVGAMQDQGLI